MSEFRVFCIYFAIMFAIQATVHWISKGGPIMGDQAIGLFVLSFGTAATIIALRGDGAKP